MASIEGVDTPSGNLPLYFLLCHIIVLLSWQIIFSLSCGPHVNLITAKAAASFYALKTLKSHSLSSLALWDTLLAQITSVVTIASEPASIDYDRSFEKNRDVDVDSMSHKDVTRACGLTIS